MVRPAFGESESPRSRPLRGGEAWLSMFECQFVAVMVWHLETRSQVLPRDQGCELFDDPKRLGLPADRELTADEPVRVEQVHSAQPAGRFPHQYDRSNRPRPRIIALRFPRPHRAPAEYRSVNLQSRARFHSSRSAVPMTP